MEGYSFELITGPMSCGKTEELLRRVRRCIIAKKKVKVISPDVDTRTKGDYIESRNGLWLDAIKVKHSLQILSLVKPDDEVVAIDELQFFDSNITKVICIFSTISLFCIYSRGICTPQADSSSHASCMVSAEKRNSPYSE